MNESMVEDVRIDQAARIDLEKLWGMSLAMRQGKRDGYFERCIERQDAGEIGLYIIRDDRADMGYCVLNWQPKYAPFKKFGLPEIQDLNILPEYRQRGLATRLIEHCEDLARSQGHADMGIGVGLNPTFGAAQRLYVKLGYVPDGQGINYDRQVLDVGEFKPNDDQLCLMMVKAL